MKKWRSHKGSFRQKLLFFVLSAILAVTVTVSIVMSTVFIYTTTQIARELAWEQENSIAKSLDQQFFAICQLGEIAAVNKVLLNDIENKSENIAFYDAYSNQVYSELLDIRRMNRMIDYVVMVKYNDQSVKYVGHKWVEDKDRIYEEIASDYGQAVYTEDRDVYMHLDQCVFEPEGYCVNFYFPVYDEERVYKEVGFICIGIQERRLFSLFEDSGTGIYSEAYIIDNEGRIVTCDNEELIGTDCPLKFENEEKEFSFESIILKSVLQTCSWNVVARISVFSLIKNYIKYFLLIILAMCFICGLALVICTGIAKHLNDTLYDLQNQMNMVAEGKMESRMEETYQEEEFRQMAHSFNKMVDAVDRLLDQVKEEQQQVKRIELEALQAQIKPHFLYNTLESIHWQAVMDGNEKISEIVKALAQYYRLCLGKGADIVTLDMELEHIQNYLIIQNVRYKNILECRIHVPEELMKTPIPKMTLQPLVENCIYHGVKRHKNIQGIISISGTVRQGKVLITVNDNGVGMDEQQVDEINRTIGMFDEQSGYGVRNVNKRLEILFGAQYGLHYESILGQGTTVTVTLPEETEEAKG